MSFVTMLLFIVNKVMLEKLSHTWLYLTHCYPILQVDLIFLLFDSLHQNLFKSFYGFVVVLAMLYLNAFVCYWHTVYSNAQQSSYQHNKMCNLYLFFYYNGYIVELHQIHGLTICLAH